MKTTNERKLDIAALPVACPVCGERIPKLDRDHAKAHGSANLAAFRNAHGIDYATLQQRSVAKFKTLYNIDTNRWCPYDVPTPGGGKRPRTCIYRADYAAVKDEIKGASRYPLNLNTALMRHIEGTTSLAILPQGTHARFFGFDVDSGEWAAEHTQLLVEAMTSEGIPREHIHISASGGKGTHVEIFTNKHVSLDDWALFARYIKYCAGLGGYKKVEFRPDGLKAWKLPLTFHYRTGNFAAFCDQDSLELLDVEESHDYLHTIQQMSADMVRVIIERARKYVADIERQEDVEQARQAAEERVQRQAIRVHDESVFHSTEDKAQAVIRAMKDGLTHVGTRWEMSRAMIPYMFHELGWTVDDIRAFFEQWIPHQIDAGKCDSTYAEAMVQTERLITSWLPKTTGFFARKPEITITRAEVEWVLSPPDRNTRLLLWALMLRSKVYAKKDGTFHTSDIDIQRLLRKARDPQAMLKRAVKNPDELTIGRGPIAKSRQWLVENGYIVTDLPTFTGDIKEHRKALHVRYAKRHATVYRLLYEPPTDGSDVVDEVEFSEEMDCRDLLTTIAAKLYDRKQLYRFKLIKRDEIKTSA